MADSLTKNDFLFRWFRKYALIPLKIGKIRAFSTDWLHKYAVTLLTIVKLRVFSQIISEI